MTDAIPAFTLADQPVTRSDLAGATGPGHLIGCDLNEAELSKLDLTGWVFERCTLRRTELSGARLELSRWLNCRGAFASFVGAGLEDAVFQSSDFNNASFRRAVLSSASFKGCKLTGADFTDSKSLGIVFEETLLVSAKLPSFSFKKAVLKGLDLSSADLSRCDFREAVFEGSSLREANIEAARFEGADLRGADLGGLPLLKELPRFRGASISTTQAAMILKDLGLQVLPR